MTFWRKIGTRKELIFIVKKWMFRFLGWQIRKHILDNITLTVHTEVNWQSEASDWRVGGNGWKNKDEDEFEIAKYLLGLACKRE